MNSLIEYDTCAGASEKRKEKFLIVIHVGLHGGNPILSACSFAEFDTSVISLYLYLCRLIYITRQSFLIIALEGKILKYTVNMFAFYIMTLALLFNWNCCK